MRKTLLLFSVVLGICGQAKAAELEIAPLGKIEINSALSVYLLSGSRINEDGKQTRIDVGSAILSLNKKKTSFGFTLVSGVYAMPVLGIDTLKTSKYVDLFSPLPLAYFEFTPKKNLHFTIGRLGTLIGYEAPFTYQNNYIQRGLVWNMQPLFHHGLRFSYLGETVSARLGLNDGYYSLGVDSEKQDGKKIRKLSYALEGSLGLTPLKDLSLSFNFFIPERDAKPDEVAFPANKRQYNLVASYVLNNFSLGADLLYVYAPKSSSSQVFRSARAYGLAWHISYDYKTFKVSLRAEYVKDKKDEIDLVGIGDNNRGYTLTLSPGYYKDHLFIRADLSYVKADKDFADYNNGRPMEDSQRRIGLELGFSF